MGKNKSAVKVSKPLRQSAGIVVVRQEGGNWRVLVLRCFSNWDFPKGGLEPGETHLDAAIRETREETGLTDLSFRWGEVWQETAPYSRPPKVARYYLASTPERHVSLPVSEELGRPEHDEWRWVDFRNAARLLPPRLQGVLAWVRANLGV